MTYQTDSHYSGLKPNVWLKPIQSIYTSKVLAKVHPISQVNTMVTSKEIANLKLLVVQWYNVYKEHAKPYTPL